MLECNWKVYADNYLDDGDIDLEVGLSAYYTGSPGIEMGTFEQPYEDSLGNVQVIEYNECSMIGSRSQQGAHSGRGTMEYCDLDTSLHEGREYTILLRTWSVPFDDFLLSYAFAVFEGPCGDGIGNSAIECLLPGEGGNEGFDELEAAFCEGTQAQFCLENPNLCG